MGDKHLMLHRQLFFVTQNRDDVLRVMVEVVVPRVLRNFHLLFAVVLNMSLVHLLSQLLDALGRSEIVWTQPHLLVHEHLSLLLLYKRESCGASLHTLVEGDHMVGNRFNVANQQVFVALKGQGTALCICYQNGRHLPSVFEITCMFHDFVQNVNRRKWLPGKVVHVLLLKMVQYNIVKDEKNFLLLRCKLKANLWREHEFSV